MNSHWNFVIAAYGVTTVAVGALIAWVMIEHRALQRRLADMEARRAAQRNDAP
ncbi:MAG: heme exporter protein CcmD [Beijerinckiaceae bacterium]